MLHQLSSSPDPDQSSCSSDTGSILIRSTRVLLKDLRPGPGPGPGSVQITVQKLCEDPAPVHRPPETEQLRRSAGTQRQQRPDRAAPQPGLCADRLKKLELTKEIRQLPADRKLPAGTHRDDGQPGDDVLTSRFAAGGRGVVLAALKQRSRSAPRRKEVTVQLLDPPGPLRTGSQDAVGVTEVYTEAGPCSGCPGDDTNTTAALIKAQSQVESQVSQLAAGVQKLLQVDRGRSLSQQMVQHLETLHSQQLQQQSQLVESALRMVMGHCAPVTPDLRSASENVPDNQQPSSTATRAAAAAAAAMETGPVAMETPCHDRWPEQTSVPTANQPAAAGSHLHSSANHSQAAASRANEMLREMGRLKSEMKMLLMSQDSKKTTRPGPDHHQSQQNLPQSQQNQSQQNQSKSQQNLSQPNYFQSQHSQSQSQPSQSQPSQSQHFQSQHFKSQPSQPQHFKSQSSQSQHNQTHSTQSQLSQQSQSVLAQRRPVVPSMLEEAGQVLRQVRRQKKVLEENLEALLRAKTGEVLHCQLEALAANRDWTQEVRIKKTVNAWIDTLSKDIQADMSSEGAASKHSASRDAAVTSQQKAAGSSAHTGRGRPVSAPRGTGSKMVVERGGRGQTAGHRALQGAEPDRATGGLTEDGESYLTRLYGRAPYDGLRRTLKKSPYLRFSSPGSPLSRKPRPRLVESIRGVKMKSCKTQTCLAPPLSPSPGPPQHHYFISSSHLTSAAHPAHFTVTPADSYSVPMAIPLGRPRMDSTSRCPAERLQEVTSPPTSPPTAPPTCSVVAVDDGASEPPSQKEEQQTAAGEAPPPPFPPSVDIMEKKSEEDEDEEKVFPGTDFLSVADVVQQEEVSVVGEEEVQVDGGPSPPPVLYQGPVFPPQAPPAPPAQDQTSVPGLDLQRDSLENRLVEWVEQQLMSRMILEIYHPPPTDPAQNDSTDQSEHEEQSITSDIVETAGGGGLQLFIDSNTSVDSALIRQLVDEVLTEHVALLLGHRDRPGPEPGLEPPEPGPGAHQEHKLVTLVPTPVPTPPPSPVPPTRETPPLTTPPPSEPTSRLEVESPQPIAAAELVATPTSSPEPAPSAGSPPAVHQAPPPFTWGDAELPLDEERPEEHLDTHPQPLLMSVAEEEPPLSSPPPPPLSVPPAPSPPPPPPPGPDPRPASPCSSSEDSSSSSSSSSSSVVTAGTEAALKHISEGELLISVNQLAAMTEDEAVHSFSSSLQELQEMDFDPPSEGQVRGHDLLLTLLTKMEQGVTHTHRGERPQPEGSWGRDQEEEEEVSMGEVRDDQTSKPHRTTNPKSYSKSTAAQRGQTCSPGQISQCADVSEISFEATNQGSVTIGDLMVEPVGTLPSDLSPSPLPLHHHHPILVRQSGGGRKVDVHLPSIRPEEEEEEEEEEEVVMKEEVMEVSAAADTDSSTNDVF